MKVLFSNPPWWGEDVRWTRHGRRWLSGVRAGSRWPLTQYTRSRPDHFVFGEYLPYPFFMGYACTYLQARTGVPCELRDSIALRESSKSYYSFLKETRYDYIFIETATPSWNVDSQVIRQIHEISPQTKIVVTGPITTTRSEEILEKLPVHACIRGEYEKGAVKVINGASGIVDFDLLTAEEMNAAPFPYFDDPIAYRYWDGNPKGQVAPHAQVWSSRGCPYKCIFCVWPAAMTGNDPSGEKPRKVRYYTKDYVENFLRDLIRRFQFKCIYFDDDTFNLGNRHTVEMCEVMERIGLPWGAMCRADTVKLDTWKRMKESGCFGVKIGIESGNQWVVDNIVNKHLDLEYVRQVIAEIHRVGMTVHGTFTYGLPGETREQMLETKRFITTLGLDTLQESGTADIEGTPLHTLSEQGSLKTYGGAKVDSGYQQVSDGAQKWRKLSAELRES
jgi:radical SAM superfamily enzyme YgiQ (UPF0313 family)